MLITKNFWKPPVFKNVSFVILILQTCLVLGQQKVVVIDPGHGGKDTGAIGINGLYEKSITLEVAQEMVRLNRVIFNDQYAIYLTRYKDTLISLTDRNLLTKILRANVFVSLHCNASKWGSKGAEIYVNKVHTNYRKASIKLGISVLKESSQKVGFKRRGIKYGNFQVLRETAFCPAILIEMGFLTNTDEADYFLKPENTRAMALAILVGINNYLKLEL